MGTSPVTRGSVVLVRFPFSDLSASKLRPAVVLAAVAQNDYVLLQVTSKPYSDPRAVELTAQSFSDGGLLLTSYARPSKLFTASNTLIAREAGRLSPDALRALVDTVVAIIRP